MLFRLAFAVGLAVVATNSASSAESRLLRSILSLRYAAEIGTDKAEMTRLAKDISVEASLAIHGKQVPEAASGALSLLMMSSQIAVKYWDLCPENVWQRQPKLCSDAAQEVSTALGVPTDIYVDPRIPWKPFSSYLLSVVHSRTSEAIAAIQ